MKLEINSTSKTGKFTNIYKLNNKFLTNESNKKSHGKLENLERNKNENTTYLNLRDRAKALLREKFIDVNAYIEKDFKSPSLYILRN